MCGRISNSDDMLLRPHPKREPKLQSKQPHKKPKSQKQTKQTTADTHNEMQRPYLRAADAHVAVDVVVGDFHGRRGEAEAAGEVGEGQLGQVPAVEEGEEGGGLDARALGVLGVWVCVGESHQGHVDGWSDGRTQCVYVRVFLHARS